MTQLGSSRNSRIRGFVAPLPWIGPALALIALVVFWPALIMIRTAFRAVNGMGIDRGWIGLDNFRQLVSEPNLPSVVLRTVVWVGVIVAVTLVLSLALAQLFNQSFPGRRVTRWALIAPWAASVYMTGVTFRWMLDPYSGPINVFLSRIGLVELGSGQAGWLGRPEAAIWWMIGVGIFVSLPFTTYALIAGLQTIPHELYEAASMDGASLVRRYRAITLPLLEPAILVAVLINMINVFNSFPIIWAMTRGGPNDQTSTTTLFMYSLKQSSVSESAAMSVVNFGLVALVVVLFLRFSKWKDEAPS